MKQRLDDLHTPGSALFHQWMTPDQFGKEFSASDADIATITTWLEGKGLHVTKVSSGRQTLEFEGTAGQFREAFGAEIHQYAAQGGTHFANSAAPQIPAALAPVFGGFVSLNNFAAKPHAKLLGHAAYDPVTHLAKPAWTQGSGNGGLTYFLSPADFAVQYDLDPVYASGVNGTGQTIAVIGSSNIDQYFVNQFRALFGLPTSAVQVIIDGDDPGLNGINDPFGQTGFLDEQYLDVEEAGAVAPGATIDLVIASSTPLTPGYLLAAEHAVYSNVAPVISWSIDECELNLGVTNQALSALYQQAAAQGITVVVSSSDSGSAGCDNFDQEQYAVDGLAVNGFSSTPYNVSVGGTDFFYSAYNGGATALSQQIATYWNQTPSNAAPAVSLLKPAPEQVWNDSQFGLNAISVYSVYGFTDIIAGSGGADTCGQPTLNSLANGQNCTPYPKPSWQAGTGVPADGVRDLPDVSLFAANGYNYVSYPTCMNAGDCQPAATGGTIQISGAGGTSASAPAFAGIMALVAQKYGRQGQANYTLYPLATQFPAVFHDITVGTNSVPCAYTVTSGHEAPKNCIAAPRP